MVRRQLQPSVMQLLQRANPEMTMSRLQRLLRHYLSDDDGDNQNMVEPARAGPDADADIDTDGSAGAAAPTEANLLRAREEVRNHRKQECNLFVGLLWNFILTART